MRMDERHEPYVFEMQWLRSMYGVVKMDRWWNVGVRRRVSVIGKMIGRLDRKAFNWSQHI